jgi:uncharacterized membrane protein YkvA (DUF1232 family)
MGVFYSPDRGTPSPRSFGVPNFGEHLFHDVGWIATIKCVYRTVSMMNLEAWKRRARHLSAHTYALYLAYRHPRTPWYAKVFAALIVGYVFSPIDPIPDFIPGVGLLDEMVVVPIGVLIAAKMIPRDVFEECREKACEVAEGEKPVSRVAAVVVVFVWLVCVALAVFLALRVFWSPTS